uniref:Uncharacterized protein n=1 Tax=Arundo donax TaxID=35708 RepID=A0A0A9GSC9_ARUDO
MMGQFGVSYISDVVFGSCSHRGPRQSLLLLFLRNLSETWYVSVSY